jgi:50S ribosomal protein L16 3-hydroxylase
MKLVFPDTLDPGRFLQKYWQKRPLLMRQGLPDYRSPLDPDELAGLACEPEVESRLVLERDGARPWEARHGPFDEQDFAALPDSHWTLLVQDLDKHLPEAAALLEPFRFLPDWRVDDVMISYAPDQGSVGPHVDDYDVFLVQAYGRRRWRIHTRPVDENEYLPGLDLRILPRFEAQYDWLLEPGDILYLPPNVAHWGIAEGECMTYSVGFRAPDLHDLARTLTEAWIEEAIPAGRYRDPDIRPQTDGGEILRAVFDQLAGVLAGLPVTDNPRFHARVGRYLTEPKENLTLAPRDRPVPAERLREELVRNGLIERSGLARMAFCRGADGVDLLFVNGRDYPLPAAHRTLLRLLTRERLLDGRALEPWLEQPVCLELLTRLYNDGCLEFPHD